MEIYNGKKYLEKIIKVFAENNMIKSPKDFKNILLANKLHINKNGDIVGWIIKGKEINFWSKDYLDVDEYAQLNQQEKKLSIYKFSYHFKPYNDKLDFFRIDNNNSKIHAHASEKYFSEDHIYPEKLKLKIIFFNLLVGIFIVLKYIKNPDKYPLLEENADMYNSIIEGGKY